MLGTGKDHVYAFVSSNKYGVGIYLNESVWSSPLVKYKYKGKPKGRRGPTLEETRPDHAIMSSVAITKLPLGHAILKKKNKQQKGEMRFLKILFLWIF